MNSKNRLFISIAVILVIVGAMAASFGRSLFMLDIPSVELPSIGITGDSSSSPGAQPEGDHYQSITVTPGTVQNVIATLSRSDSYYRELAVETFWEGGSSSVPVQTWVDNGWSHIRRVLPSGAIRHDLLGRDTLYYWYEGSQQYVQAPADLFSSDLSQRIPTFETVLELDSGSITAAGQEVLEDTLCIRTEVTDPEGSCLERYWVSVDTGLLVRAEREQDGLLVYRMSALSAATTPCPPSAAFSLPDGTVLHSVS